MPTYDYECTQCGATFELFQSITAKAKRRVKAEEKNCTCDATVRRLIGTGGGIIFKGSGFYQTDYRSESYRKAAKADTATSKTEKTEKTETKTANADANKVTKPTSPKADKQKIAS